MVFKFRSVILVLILVSLSCENAKSDLLEYLHRQECNMSFFVSSLGHVDSNGNPLGGAIGDISIADQKCQNLATSKKFCEKKTWRAYLSDLSENARDRIGNGPWHNAKGTLLANNLEDLHSSSLAFELFLTESEALISNQEFIFTGSDASGHLKFNCSQYNSNLNSNLGSMGRPGFQWNYVTDINCDPAAFQGAPSFGRIFCFAID